MAKYKKAKRPGFSQINRLQEQALHDKLRIARELISHPAEKGRSLEGEVAAVLREVLPFEYGVGTGFIVFPGGDGPELSAQLDIIIYDAVRCGPIGRLAGCEVYPIEAVYAYVEVKASLSVSGPGTVPKHNSLQRCMEQNHVLRRMRTRRFWEIHQFGSPYGVYMNSVDDWVPVRAFVFAFEPDGATSDDPDRLAQAMSDCAKRHSAHLHGVFVLEKCYLTTIPVDVSEAGAEDYYHVAYTADHPFTAFKLHLLKALGTFPRPHDNWVPAWETYFDMPTEWKECAPQSDSL